MDYNIEITIKVDSSRKLHTNEVYVNRILGIFFLGFFSDSFFSQKTETLLWKVSVFSLVFVMISVLTQFFFMFQNKYTVKFLNHDENIKMLMLKRHKFTTIYAAIYGNRVNKVV